MTFSTPTLMAYAEGELDAATRADIEAEIPHDPELAEAVAAQLARRAALQATLRDTLDGAQGQDAPAKSSAFDSNEIVQNSMVDRAPMGAENVAQSVSGRWPWAYWSGAQWWGIAVVLLLGVFIGRLIPTRNDDPFIEDQGRVLARGPLDSALTEQSGGSIDRETGIQIGVSYLAKNGDFCRTFTLKAEQVLAGLACRRDAQWIIDALTRTKADASSAYRMAGASVPALILGLVEDTIAGDPLDAEQEIEARELGWER
jgi:hypothetical protein